MSSATTTVKHSAAACVVAHATYKEAFHCAAVSSKLCHEDYAVIKCDKRYDFAVPVEVKLDDTFVPTGELRFKLQKKELPILQKVRPTEARYSDGSIVIKETNVEIPVNFALLGMFGNVFSKELKKEAFARRLPLDASEEDVKAFLVAIRASPMEITAANYASVHKVAKEVEAEEVIASVSNFLEEETSIDDLDKYIYAIRNDLPDVRIQALRSMRKWHFVELLKRCPALDFTKEVKDEYYNEIYGRLGV